MPKLTPEPTSMKHVVISLLGEMIKEKEEDHQHHEPIVIGNDNQVADTCDCVKLSLIQDTLEKHFIDPVGG